MKERVTVTRQGQMPKPGSVSDTACPVGGGGQGIFKDQTPRFQIWSRRYLGSF